VHRLTPRVQHYDWGSATAIPSLLGVPVDGRPWAELWFGAHPVAPSTIELEGAARPLDEAIAANPASMLGHARDDGLPFLVKVLAAGAPLSLQAHPSSEQAAAGFEREERAGVPRDAPHRTYRDANHKPELICALTPFTALYGFRAPDESAALLASLEVPLLAPVVERLASSNGKPVRDALAWLLELGPDEGAALARAVARAVAAEGSRGPDLERGWAARIAEQHPGDPGVVTALLLNLVRLEPGEALFLPGRTLHAYLEGMGVEVMASSDNVIRGGLTTKHVDVPELLRIVQAEPTPAAIVPRRREGDELVYDTPAPEFRLSALELDGRAVELETQGPEILLCTAGSAELVAAGGDRLGLGRGQAAFLAAATGPYRVIGSGTVHRTTTT
jgi:mannose-6-phosphate isomerase